MPESPSTPSKPKPWGIWATLGFSMIVLALFLLIQVLVALVFLGFELNQNPGADLEVMIRNLESDGFLLAIATILSAPLCTALIVFFARLRKRFSVKNYLCLKKPSLEDLVHWCLITVIFIVVLDLLKSLVDRPVVPVFVTEIYETAYFLPALYIALVIAAPVFEEVFFRGFIFQGIKYSKLGALGAIVLPAFVWAVIHLQYEWYDVAGIFLFGLVLGFARLRAGSIYVAIAMHALNNFLAVIQVAWAKYFI